MEFKDAGILGVGTYVPERVVTNLEFEKVMDTTDEWIRTMTGIEERRFVAEGQATSDLAVEAARKALKVSGDSVEDIELIIVATCTPDYPVQSTACLVQEKLGASKAAAFDLNAACSGFVYGLTMATSLIKSEMYKKVLVIGAEVFSKTVDLEDRNTAILFGDGAAAAVVGEVEKGYGLRSSYLMAEGEDQEILRTPAGGTARPTTQEELDNRENFLKMKGPEVFKFAVKALPKATNEALAKAHMTVEDIDMIIPHQANKRIIDSAAKRIGVPTDKFYLNLHKYGNTSAASIGLALGEALEKGLIKKGDILAFTGFGAGLTYASTIIKWAY